MENGVLQLFSRNGDQCMSGVCRTRFISKPCPTSIVDALIAAGYVEARREAADRRLVRIGRGESGSRHPGQGAADPRQRLLVRLGALGEAEVALLATSLEDPAHALARVGEDRERTP